MTHELYNSLESIRKWLADINLPLIHTDGLSVDEKKQLLAVNRSIEILHKQGVPIPDELRQIKLELSAKDTAPSTSTQNNSALEPLEELINHLSNLKTQAQKIKSQLKPTRTPSGPKKHYDVALEDLIEFGYLNIESRLELQWKKNGEVYEGRLCKNGKISVRTNSGEKVFKSLSSAASEIAGSSLNGWKHWSVVALDGKRTSLEKIRKKYINN